MSPKQQAKDAKAHRLPDGTRHIPGLEAGQELQVGMHALVAGQWVKLRKVRNHGGFWGETKDGRQIKVRGTHSVTQAYKPSRRM